MINELFMSCNAKGDCHARYACMTYKNLDVYGEVSMNNLPILRSLAILHILRAVLASDEGVSSGMAGFRDCFALW